MRFDRPLRYVLKKWSKLETVSEVLIVSSPRSLRYVLKKWLKFETVADFLLGQDQSTTKPYFHLGNLFSSLLVAWHYSYLVLFHAMVSQEFEKFQAKVNLEFEEM